MDDLLVQQAPSQFTEPHASAVFLGIVGLLTAASVLISRIADRAGVPVVLLFLVLGLVGGSEGLGAIAFDNYAVAVRLGTLALVLILFDGGLNTTISSVRQVLLPSMTLATFGVVMTAGLLAVLGRMLGLAWTEALLVGAVVSSTDAAAVFAVLRGGGVHLRQRVGRTLEVESCVNDPMAVILTATLVEMFTGTGEFGWQTVVNVPVQLAVGAGVGLVAGYSARWLLGRIRVSTSGLYPPLTVAIALLSFCLATISHGSGFLSVYTTGLVLGNGPMPYRSGMVRVHDALAWLSQIGMFLMFGLLAFPSRLLDVWAVGLGMGLLLAVVARPLAVWACMWPFGYTRNESLYIAWIGLRGAVPIVLATFPLLGGVEGSSRVFDIVFFIVVISSLIPGSTIRPVTRLLGMDAPRKPSPPTLLEINSIARLNGELTSFHIDPSLVVCGARLSELALPRGASVVLIVRGTEPEPARGDTVLRPGDHVYVFFKPEDRPLIELLFGVPQMD